jgi:hypothetical protein
MSAQLRRHSVLTPSNHQEVTQRERKDKTILEGDSLEEASVSIGRIGQAIRGGSCEDVDTWAMMCIWQKWQDVWFSCVFRI